MMILQEPETRRTIYMLDTPLQQEWYMGVGRLHRTGGPASIDYRSTKYYPNGVRVRQIQACEWVCDGMNHRIEGPAEKHTGYDAWWYMGCVHNANGPAQVWYDPERETNGNSKEIYSWILFAIELTDFYEEFI